MSQEEPSIIEYAHYYGLIRDHLEIDPLQGLAALDNAQTQLDLDNTPDLFHIRQGCVKVPEERLTIDAGTASLLSEIASFAKPPPSSDCDDAIDTHRVRRMKVELPLLSSDHEIDLLRFAPRIVPDLEHEFLPLETIDEEADEGLTWPSSYYALPDKYDRRVRAEKLEVRSDAFRLLKEIYDWGRGDENSRIFEHVELPYEKKSKVQPVSPPLLPLSPEILPFIPSSDTGRLELLSDHISPTKEEQTDIERKIFRDDAVTSASRHAESSSQNSDHMLLDSESLGDIYSPLKGIADPPSSPPTPRRSLQDRKVEVPLSPPTSEQPPPWKRKSVSWSEALTEVIHDLPQPIPNPENVSSDDIDAFFEESIRPIAIKAERGIEQEQLQEVDTTLRVKVPIMDFSLPVAPWKAGANVLKSEDGNECYRKMLSEMKELHFKKHIWPTRGKAERELKCTPFPAALGKVETQESIADDRLIEKYLKQPERMDVDTLTWKPEGLRLFDDLPASYEEVLGEGSFPEERDIESLIRKRRFELQEDEELPQQSKGNSIQSNERPRSKQQRTSQLRDEGDSSFANFSALSALNGYIALKKGIVEEPRIRLDHLFPNASTSDPPKQTRAQTNQSKPAERTETHHVEINEFATPSPHVVASTSDTPFVVSASFLSNRRLARQVQRLFPSAIFIERDFNLHLNPTERTLPKSDVAPKLINTMAEEADILLSPSTGLIWTTLQKIKQRSLPGQASRSAIRARITSTASRYERLIVLVSDNRHSEQPTTSSNADDASLDNSDCEAFVEFTTFCSALPAEVQLTLVNGGEDMVVKWIVAVMVKYCVTDSSLKVIQDETLWEIFLRRAGMNAFAAQAILGSLNTTDPNSTEASKDGGLAAFVTMSVEARYTRFESLLGGRRLLGRISRVLDARWQD